MLLERPIPNFYKLAGKSAKVDVTVRDGDTIFLEDGMGIQVVSTPGHSADGVSYRLGNSLFIGDAIPVKGDIPIYINAGDALRTLHTIRELDGIHDYYPAWDRTYAVSDINEKIDDAVHIIRTLDEQVKTILETDKAADIAAITDMVCEGLNMPYLKENPLFLRTIMAHCLSCSDFPDK